MNNINVSKLKEMLVYGAEVLSYQVDRINALNVFPVPDGDTGTNMNMTSQSGKKAIVSVEYKEINKLTKDFSRGMLMGARGNSGVILSQFFRGVSESLSENLEVVGIEEFQNSIKQGKIRAYGSVIKAVEGTILTVIKDMSNFKYTGDDFIEYFTELLKVGEKSLENTPELLPILKEVGVVDSGGAGLIEIFKGMKSSLIGEELDTTSNVDFETFKMTEEHPINPEEIVFGFCTEMLIRLEKEIDMTAIRNYLESVGDSIVAINDDNILKVHVHTENPVKVFEYGSKLGDFINVKSENMRIQAEEAHGKQEKKEIGIVAVASSKEMAELFSEVQNVQIVMGGQTLNPSTENILNAIKNVNAKNVILLPNNSNIIMSGEAAKDLIDDVCVEVIRTKHMTQGLECLINFSEDNSFLENVDIMKKSLDKIINFEITKAIKDTTIEGVKISENDNLIIKDGKIIASESKNQNIFENILKNMEVESLEVINVMLGTDGDEKLIKKWQKELDELDLFIDIEIYKTNQDIYPYLISGIKE